MQTKPRALVVTQHFAPEPNFITEQVAHELARSHDVTVVTSHPHYPAGKFYLGTRWWTVSRTLQHGLTVYRVPMFPDHSKSAVRRLASYMSFAVVAGVVALAVSRKPSIVWIYHGPFVSGLVAPLLKLIYGSKLVLTCADLWPESFAAAGMRQESVAVRLSYRFRRWFNRHMDMIVCATEGTKLIFEREGVPKRNLVHIPVWVPVPDTPSTQATRSSSVVYSGNIGPAQSLGTVVRGCTLLAQRYSTFTATIAGSGTELPRMQALVPEELRKQVDFVGRVEPGTALAMSQNAGAQILSLSHSANFAHTVPSKLGFCLAAGSPILFTAPGETADILRRLPGTFEFNEEDEESFCRAAEQALALSAEDRADIRTGLRKAFETQYSARSALARYRSLFSDLGS